MAYTVMHQGTCRQKTGHGFGLKRHCIGGAQRDTGIPLTLEHKQGLWVLMLEGFPDGSGEDRLARHLRKRRKPVFAVSAVVSDRFFQGAKSLG